MISANLSHRLIFALSLLGLAVSAFLLYEYSLSGTMVCPVGVGCDIVRASPYASFFGVSIPVLGIVFYLVMAVLSIFRFRILQFLTASAGVAFGLYLTYLEAFVINAFCFWCVLSFIISLGILAAILLAKGKSNEV